MEVGLSGHRVEIATSFGPRVIGLRREGGPQVFARLPPEAGIELPDGRFTFHGGHRLWASPETVEVTYAPDDDPCVVTEDDGVITVTGPADRAGLSKEMEISGADGRVRVIHRLRNRGGETMSAAPWALTQLPIGGVAIVPLVGEETTPLPNRHLVLWPYTTLTDPRLSFEDRHLLVDAGDGPDVKLGTGATWPRLGYLRGGELFVKETGRAVTGDVPDFGASAQVFVGQGFCELETVGGLVALAAGEAVEHEEAWQVLQCPDLETAVELTLQGST